MLDILLSVVAAFFFGLLSSFRHRLHIPIQQFSPSDQLGLVEVPPGFAGAAAPHDLRQLGRRQLVQTLDSRDSWRSEVSCGVSDCLFAGGFGNEFEELLGGLFKNNVLVMVILKLLTIVRKDWNARA